MDPSVYMYTSQCDHFGMEPTANVSPMFELFSFPRNTFTTSNFLSLCSVPAVSGLLFHVVTLQHEFFQYIDNYSDHFCKLRYFMKINYNLQSVQVSGCKFTST